MTVEWANISFEQRTWQWIHRIAVLSGHDDLIPLLSGNSGFMVTEELHRCVVRGSMPHIEALMSHPIAVPDEFERCLNSQIESCDIDEDVECCSVVHLFGHHKQDHRSLRELIAEQMLQFLASEFDIQQDFRKSFSQSSFKLQTQSVRRDQAYS